MSKIRVGAINWDCALPPETYFGYYQTRTLSPSKYRTVTPYYADVLSDNEITYHYKNQEEYDRELAYACDAGIDYFAYVFYPDEGSRKHISLTYSDCSHRVYELNYARRMHQSSKLKDKIGIAAVVSKHPFTDSDLDELAELLSQPYYEKIDGRPLVYLYNSINEMLIESICSKCSARGIAKPYFVIMFDGSLPQNANYALVDAISAYACVQGDINTYDELCDVLERKNTTRLSRGHSVIPLYTTGWNPAPRIDIPSPWVTYGDKPYAKTASADELKHGAKRLSDWIKNTAGQQFAGHILAFAWNEFEEGGWICPTFNDDLTINTERVTAMSEIIQLWKEELTK